MAFQTNYCSKAITIIGLEALNKPLLELPSFVIRLRASLNILLCIFFTTREILQTAIDKGEIPSFDAFTNEPKAKQRKRKKFYEREKKEAEAELAKQNLGLHENLVSASLCCCSTVTFCL